MKDRESIVEGFKDWTRYRLEQWVSSVGTVGDKTTLRDIERMERSSVPELRKQISAADNKFLADKDVLDIQKDVRRASAEARTVLETDSVTQRLSRSIGYGANYVGELGKSLLSSAVTGGEHPPSTRPLPILSNEPDSTGRPR